MAMQFLTANQKDAGCNFEIWLDTSKVGVNGNPDPSYVKSYAFGIKPPGWAGATLNGTSYTDWESYCAAESQLLAQHDLQTRLQPPSPTVLPLQGTTF